MNNLARLQKNGVALLGVPHDANSSFMRGPAEAPPLIRQVLHNGAANLCAENEVDLGSEPRWQDVGDVEFGEGDDFDAIETAVSTLLNHDQKPLILGGDHAITYPVIRAVAQHHPQLTILHLDAHPDLYDELDGNRHSHACPFARIMENGLAQRLVQVGIRTLNPHQRAQASRFGVEIIEARDWRGDLPSLAGPVYLSLDLDVLDPAFAPGVSHHEPGGFSVRQVLSLLQQLDVQLVGADIVEYNPRRDWQQMTAAVAAKLVKEVSVLLLRHQS